MGNYVIDFELRPPVTIIGGDTGTGKSLFWRWLTVQVKLPENRNIFEDIKLLNFSSDIDDIVNKKNRLFVIDQADVLLQGSPDIVEHIALDVDNEYVIMCRSSFDFDVSPNHYATIVEANGVFTLNYRFNVKGWY